MYGFWIVFCVFKGIDLRGSETKSTLYLQVKHFFLSFYLLYILYSKSTPAVTLNSFSISKKIGQSQGCM